MVFQLAFLSGCASTVPATVTMRPASPLEANATIYLKTRVRLRRIALSLRDAGLTPTNQVEGAGYTLDVRVGSGRGSSDCGRVSNVAYILTRAGSRVMAIKGRGRTGSCTPNVFDDMSQKLAWFTGS